MRTLLLLLTTISCSACFSQSNPVLSGPERIRIREGMTISKLYAGKLFPGFDAAPFSIVLVTDTAEFLINHPRPSADFTPLGFDSLLGSNIYYRKRVFGTQLLATFPAVGGVPCIVIGTPANTGKNSSEWVTTLLHEHFHQYQSSQPGYHTGVDSLDLSGGDQSGMWMLNYPFPYDSAAVVKQFKKYAAALAAAVRADDKNFRARLTDYTRERKAFTGMLSPKDERYFSFQLWQEGLARHTEYALLQLMRSYEPSLSFRALPDYQPFPIVAQQLYASEMRNCLAPNLPGNKRVSFYSMGFAEGELLDRVDAGWRGRYWMESFRVPGSK